MYFSLAVDRAAASGYEETSCFMLKIPPWRVCSTHLISTRLQHIYNCSAYPQELSTLPKILRSTMDTGMEMSDFDPANHLLLHQNHNVTQYDQGGLQIPRSGRSRRADTSSNKREVIQRNVVSWFCFAAAVLFLVLTTLYATQIPLSSRFKWVYNSSSNTIFILSLLSGITGILLSAVIGITFENLQWLLLGSKKGLRATDFLAIHPGTGIPGLLSLIVRNGQPLFATVRLWSTLRLLGTAIPFIL
jgi:hypothetical protein